ncbi:MAG: His-Xaa-Ser system radical SAM maturase HxsB [Elusimicrobia bacterium]|nr:His-Xaa-Ser system radical SAM maturase HxsB [Elusimicrobiota bacterium]
MRRRAPAAAAGAKPAFFRFRRLGRRILITNDFGRHRLMTDAEFRSFAAGSLDGPPDLLEALARDGFLAERMDFEDLAEAWRARGRYLWQGPTLHIIVVTLRCDHRCLYCQASAGRMSDKGVDMTPETARLVVDRIFESASPALTIEFQGGEPLANWPVVRFIVEYARAKGAETGTSLGLSLVTNLSLMDDEKLDFLLDNGVGLCTSLDGPADLHNANRLFSGGDSHERTTRWFRRISERAGPGRSRIEALLTVTRRSLPRAREIVDEYARVGAGGIFLRSLSPLGLARGLWERIGYAPEEFLAFYREAFARVLELNRDRPFVEQSARLFLAKILSDEDPNFLDIRSPCGAGIGQLAYNFDGSVYTCDEGRMLSRMGDESFRIGSVRSGTRRETVAHPAVRALAVASCLDAQPDCSRCAYKPYCGICPIQCYVEQGDIMGHMPSNSRCRIHKGILDLLFEKLENPKNETLFRRWLRRPEDGSAYQRSL